MAPGVAVGALCLALAACGSSGSSSSGGGAAGSSATTSASNASTSGSGKRIGLVLPDFSTNEYILGLRNGVLAQAKKVGATVLVSGSNAPADQTNAMETYVGEKVNAIIVDSIDGHAIVPAIEAANRAKIPVIAIQSNVFGGKIATFIGGSETVSGTYIGQNAVQWCQKYNPCEVGIVEGEPTDQSGLTEDAAFKAVVGKHPNIKIVGGDYTQYDPSVALTVATNLLTAHPNIKYMYVWWDPGAAATVKELQSRGLVGKVGVGSQNGGCSSLALIVKGQQTQTSAFFPDIIGTDAVNAALKAIGGEQLPSFIEAPVLSVTTPLAKAWLAGTAQPPAPLAADIIARLKQAQAGHCGTS